MIDYGERILGPGIDISSRRLEGSIDLQFTTANHIAENPDEPMAARCERDSRLSIDLPHALQNIGSSCLPSVGAGGVIDVPICGTRFFSSLSFLSGG